MLKACCKSEQHWLSQQQRLLWCPKRCLRIRFWVGLPRWSLSPMGSIQISHSRMGTQLYCYCKSE